MIAKTEDSPIHTLNLPVYYACDIWNLTSYSTKCIYWLKRLSICMMCTSNSCNMYMRDLPDMYARAFGLVALGLLHTYEANNKSTCYKCYVTLSLP